ncbi:MAG: MTH1187 family thiamine-binding protein [Deltaproteobacteria bacterium]|nr:MTH1187 family thiamine-binding protein [Deltaproteobacteria bacterium]MBF0507738.1 MTH1187 family thiamine-binding protein [Deltaproteobacteria bacterium]
MAIAFVSVVPLGTESTSLSHYVAKVTSVLNKETSVTTTLTGMGTIIEGELADILAVVQKIHEVPFSEGAHRVMTNINIDDRRDKKSSAQAKVASVKAKLGE